jgi:hypothetical protein
MFVVDAEAYLEVPYRKLGELLKRSTLQSKAVRAYIIANRCS